MSNIRNSRTTFPRKQARRQRAAERFTVHGVRAELVPAYARAKEIEAKALGLDPGKILFVGI